MMRKVTYPILILLWGILLTMADSFADVVIGEDRIHRAVEEYVRDVLADFGGDIQVDVRRTGHLQVDGSGAVEIAVRPGSGRGNARMIPVMVDVKRGPAVIRSYPMSANVRYFDDVIVATRPIERGEPLAMEALTLERRDVTSILGRYLNDPVELDGKRARMRIAFGRTIDPRYVETIPTVNRGDLVQIRVAVGAIHASAQGVATEAGAVGDRIVVQNTLSNEKLLAEVIAPGLVQVAMR